MWPTAPLLAAASDTEIIVQVNGKRRGSVTLVVDASETDAVSAACKLSTVVSALAGKEPLRIIYVPGRILNLVV